MDNFFYGFSHTLLFSRRKQKTENMKLRLLILLASFTLFSNITNSQSYTQSVTGRVTDKESKEPLPCATVVLEGVEGVGTVTNAEGYFRLTKVPVGRQSIRISFMGYDEVVFPEVMVTSGKEVVLDAGLTERLSEIEEVSVVASRQNKDKALNSMATISTRKLNMDDAGRYAGGFYDASRMVSAFAGVAAVEGDGVNDIVIRGNSSRGLQWKLEGIEIPNPNHFTDGQGATGGAISIISSNMLSTSDFYSGAFPAEYGNATSGIMDLNLRTGNPQKREYGVQVGVVGTAVTLEGGFSKKSKASYLLNYRYSTFGLLAQMNLINLGNNNLPPVFQDLTANINLPTNKAGTFSLFAVGGVSNTGTDPEKEPGERVTWDDQFYEREDHQMLVAGLKHFYLFGDKKTSLKTVLAYTTQGDKWEDGIFDQQNIKNIRLSSNIAYPSLRVSATINSKLNARQTIRAGVVANKLYYDMFNRRFDMETQRFDTTLNQKGNSEMMESFFQWKYRISEKLEFNAGAHFIYFGLNSKTSFEPRVGLKFSPTANQSFSFGFGIHSRTEAISTYMVLIPDSNDSWIAPNKNLGFTKSAQWILGYDYAFAKNWRAKIETYYQHLYNVPVSSDPNSLFSSVNFGYGIPNVAAVNTGIACNYGIELTLEKFFTDNYYLLSTLSLFDSKYRANTGDWYNTTYNSRYVVNLLAGKDFKMGRDKQNVWGVNTKMVLRGGFCIPPVDEVASRRDQTVRYDETRMNEARLPDFFRVDAGTYIRINREKYAYIISADIQNVTNRMNTMGYSFSSERNRVVPEEGMGLIPILNFRLEF
jgi:hypothetical protein